MTKEHVSTWKSLWTGSMSRAVKIGLDMFTLAAALVMAFVLRFEGLPPVREGWRHFVLAHLSISGPNVLLVQFGMLYAWGVYSFVWRYVGLAEIRAFNGAFASSALILAAFRLFLPDQLQDFRLPLSVIAIDAILAFGFTLGLRVARRVLSERGERGTWSHADRSDGNAGRKPVLLVGAGQAGLLAARELVGRRDLAVKVEGFVDDAPDKKDAVIQGVKVLGTTADLPDLVKQLNIDHVIITIAKATRPEIRRIVQLCEEIPVKARIIPGLYDIL
jgi:FlaA1/EpsC-like NDP-sugar epimerase